MNILIKLTSIVALIIAPHIAEVSDESEATSKPAPLKTEINTAQRSE